MASRLCFGFKARGILVSRPEIRLAPLVSEGDVLTTGLPEKPHVFLFSSFFFSREK